MASTFHEAAADMATTPLGAGKNRTDVKRWRNTRFCAEYARLFAHRERLFTRIWRNLAEACASLPVAAQGSIGFRPEAKPLAPFRSISGKSPPIEGEHVAYLSLFGHRDEMGVDDVHRYVAIFVHQDQCSFGAALGHGHQLGSRFVEDVNERSCAASRPPQEIGALDEHALDRKELRPESPPDVDTSTVIGVARVHERHHESGVQESPPNHGDPVSIPREPVARLDLGWPDFARRRSIAPSA